MKNCNTNVGGGVVETLQCNVSTNNVPGTNNVPETHTGKTDKFRGKYRIASTRLQTWDYARNGNYFITICTKNRQNFFGDITDGKMILNQWGEIVQKYWLEIPLHFHNARIDEFIVMPNHMHGILIIDNGGGNVETLHCNVSTTKTDNDFYSKISPKPKSLSTMIRSYKSICTKTINRTHVETLQCNVSTIFAWQSGFYDHIIRNEKSLNTIRDYIINNPLNWMTDNNNISKCKTT